MLFAKTDQQVMHGKHVALTATRVNGQLSFEPLAVLPPEPVTVDATEEAEDPAGSGRGVRAAEAWSKVGRADVGARRDQDSD